MSINASWVCNKRCIERAEKCICWVQGDHSGCVKPPVDIKTKVPFEYVAHTCTKTQPFVDVNGRFDTT